jgi:hypothetical protein
MSPSMKCKSLRYITLSAISQPGIIKAVDYRQPFAGVDPIVEV